MNEFDRYRSVFGRARGVSHVFLQKTGGLKVAYLFKFMHHNSVAVQPARKLYTDLRIHCKLERYVSETYA